mgnify:CR=1 FL=1
MRTFLYSILGFLAATVLLWGALFIWAQLSLEATDSYWDRIPYAADVFFTCWIVAGITAALMAARRSRRRNEK